MSTQRAFTWQRAFYLVLSAFTLHLIFTFSLPQPGSSTKISSVGNSYQNPQQCEPRKPKLDLHHELPLDLTQEECERLFPKLYYEVERATQYWKARDHQITAEDIDVSWRMDLEWPQQGGGIRVLIHDNELRIVESRMTMENLAYRSRAIEFLSLLDQAIRAATASGESLPTIEAAVIFEDIVDPPTIDGTHTFWTWTSNVSDPTHERHWLIPNFDFFGAGALGSYTQTRRRAIAQDQPWSKKIPQVVWRGTVWYNPFIRGGLIEATKGKGWADVKAMDWQTKDTFMTVDEMCRYAMTAHTEGGSYSGRLKFLLNCDSLAVIHELVWRTYYTHLLEKSGPDQNYVAVRRDFSDLEAKVEHYFLHPDEAQSVINNSLQTFRNKYLTPAAQSCYLRKLIRGYSTVADTPQVYRPATDGQKVPMRRGRSFEEFLQSVGDHEESNA